MSERKVISKHYPPDFDPSTSLRKKKSTGTTTKLPVVRLSAPWSMRCKTCGEYINKGRKFNTRKGTPQDQRYYGIQIYNFYIKCTSCSAQIVFCTDPKNRTYEIVSGAMRCGGPAWQQAKEAETDEERLDRLEREMADAEADEAVDGERDAMADLEAKNADAKRAMAAADTLDELRYRNARISRADDAGVDLVDLVPRGDVEDKQRQEREDAEEARRAFAQTQSESSSVEARPDPAGARVEALALPPTTNGQPATASTPAPWPSKKKKTKKDCAALLGIKKK